MAIGSPGRGVKFETYSVPRIRGAMLDALRSADWAPRLSRHRAHKLEQAVQVLQGKLGHKPSEYELARDMGLSFDKFRKAQRDAHVTGLISLDRDWTAADSDKLARRADMSEDKGSEGPADVTLRAELREVVVHGLSRTERLIILMYYFEEMTMKEIGQTLDLSESRVSQLHPKLLIRLREQLSSRRDELQAAG